MTLQSPAFEIKEFSFRHQETIKRYFRASNNSKFRNLSLLKPFQNVIFTELVRPEAFGNHRTGGLNTLGHLNWTAYDGPFTITYSIDL